MSDEIEGTTDEALLRENNVRALGVEYKPKPGGEPFLEQVPYSGCFHGRFMIDREKAYVECGKCHEKLDPMYVLWRLASEETQWHRYRAVYQEELAKLNARRRTKCQHCKQMTRIGQS